MVMTVTADAIVRVLSRRKNWRDNFLEPEEPECQIIGFNVEQLGGEQVKVVQHGLCWGLEQKITDIPEFRNHKMFQAVKPGDCLSIVYYTNGGLAAVLSTIRGNTKGRGPALFPRIGQGVGEIKVIRNNSQGWVIEYGRAGYSPVPNGYDSVIPAAQHLVCTCKQ